MARVGYPHGHLLSAVDEKRDSTVSNSAPSCPSLEVHTSDEPGRFEEKDVEDANLENLTKGRSARKASVRFSTPKGKGVSQHCEDKRCRTVPTVSSKATGKDRLTGRARREITDNFIKEDKASVSRRLKFAVSKLPVDSVIPLVREQDTGVTSPVMMKMDPKGYYVYWTHQNKEMEFLDITCIRDTRVGKYAKIPKTPKVRNVFNLDFPENNYLAKTLTIVSGPDVVNLSYSNFFAYKEHIAKNDSMKPEEFSESVYKSFLMHLCPRPEIYEIFTSYNTKAKPYMTKENFCKFINEKQRDSRLNEILFPRLKPEQVKAIIERYEPSQANAQRGQISPEGLLFYLLGPENSVVDPEKLLIYQNMAQPLPHYYIKSSHNTYLTGQSPPLSVVFFSYFLTLMFTNLKITGQFSGVSSPEMYRQCLLTGCRCVELDCWNGKPPDEEPIITHGFTMTTEILFKLKPGQQIPSPSELLGKILIKNKKNQSRNESAQGPAKKNVAVDASCPEQDSSQMPSTQESEPTEEAEDREEVDEAVEEDEEQMKNSDEGTAGQEVTAFEEMSALVNYIQPNKFVSFEHAKKKNRSYVVSSFVETKAIELVTKFPVEFVEYPLCIEPPAASCFVSKEFVRHNW
ncbi:PLCB2 phosphodiesterase, partial [Polypterus senegalus]